MRVITPPGQAHLSKIEIWDRFKFKMGVELKVVEGFEVRVFGTANLPLLHPRRRGRMRDKKFREASSHASGVVSASAFLVGNHPASRLGLRDIFLIARPPLLRDCRRGKYVTPHVYRYLGQLCLARRGGCASKKKERSIQSGADGVVVQVQVQEQFC